MNCDYDEVSFLTRRKTKGVLETRKEKKIVKTIRKISEKDVSIIRGKKFKNTYENKKRLYWQRIRR